MFRRSSGPIVKRIDNYGPPNAKSPFGQTDEKTDLKSESTEEKIIKKNESQSADENASHVDSSGKFNIAIFAIEYIE